MAGHQGVLVVAGVREDGYREILGTKIMDYENDEF
jgi:transposase-like protein